MWQRTLEPLIAQGKVHVVGVVQEQHPARTRLYTQWRQFKWPILVDSLNLLDVDVVPVVIGLDESGVVRSTRLSPRNLAAEFIEKEFPPASSATEYARAEPPDPVERRAHAERTSTPVAWRDAADALFLHGEPSDLDQAVTAYENAVSRDPQDARARFRLGVALRRRSETPMRQPGDAQGAVDQWTEALAVNPNQYIWRRRLQQYGPRLDKPYNFYFWVGTARSDILARGETPFDLPVEPSGSELAPPAKAPNGSATAERVNTDPDGRITRDLHRLVRIDTVVTPAAVKPGARVRARIDLRLPNVPHPWWNNEAKDLVTWVDLPEGFELGEGSLSYPNPAEPETREDRAVEFDVVTAEGGRPGVFHLPGYALYYVCEDKGGKCRYLRQDFTFKVVVDTSAPTLK